MYLNTKKELEKFVNTTGEGTKENPKVNQLPWNYKIPLYLGYKIKWDYVFQVKTNYTAPFKQYRSYEIDPVFKKSYHRFNCKWDYANWDFLMEELFPKMKDDGLLTDEVKYLILDFKREDVILEAFKIIDANVPDLEYPFVHIIDGFETFHPDKIY